MLRTLSAERPLGALVLALAAAASAVAAVLGGAGSGAAAGADACPLPPPIPPTEIFGPADGEIAFATTRHGAGDVYTIGANGDGERALTRNRPVPAAVAWANDCRFAFSSSDAANGRSYLWVASPDTRELRRIAEGDDPAWSPDSTLIAFVWSNDLDVTDRRNGVYVLAADGSGRRQLARTNGAAGRPAWSPDGRSLAFADDATIRRVDVGTGRAQQLAVHREVSPPDVAWSPDDETIAFVSDGDVRVVAASGGRPARRVTTTPDDQEEGIAWQPDGTLTFLEHDRGSKYVAYGLDPGGAPLVPRRLFAVEADWPPRLQWARDGSHVLVSSQFGPRATITRADGSAPQAILRGDAHLGPSWSPDGRRLAIATAQTTQNIVGGGPLGVVEGAMLSTYPRTGCAPPLSWAPDGHRLTCDTSLGGDVALVTLTPDGGSSRLVLQDHGIGDASKNMADWEPNGRRLVYVLEGGVLALYRASRLPAPRNSYGTVLRIRGLTASAESPAWSPDGRRIAFRGTCENRTRRCRAGIYVVRADGTALKRVSPRGTNPDWSPDGRQIVFDATRNGNRDIYAVNANGTGLRRLTTSPGPDFDPSWRSAPAAP